MAVGPPWDQLCRVTLTLQGQWPVLPQRLPQRPRYG